VKIAIIGYGAIASYVTAKLATSRTPVLGGVHRAGRETFARTALGPTMALATGLSRLPFTPDLVLECAGHSGLKAHVPDTLSAGIPVLTVSIGALADQDLYEALTLAAKRGKTQLHLASGAIGALDALSSAAVGHLASVTYTGRKPPSGWRGSAAEEVIDLDALTDKSAVHFVGTARTAALHYPKNANVAASVALAGIGFDNTQVQLIADPCISANIHEIEAQGDFGSFFFRIEGKPLPGNPKSSALTAMNMISAVRKMTAFIRS